MTMNDTMNYTLLFLIFGIFIIPVSIVDSSGYSFVGVTSNGVEFPITSDVSSGNSTGTGDSILDGLGVYLTIQNIGTNGMVYFGSGDEPGEQTDIRQYVEVEEMDDWVVVIGDDDYSEVFSAPEFGVEYTYYSGYLINTTDSEPNVLGYSESRILSGSPSAWINSDGIHVSGNGKMLIKVNSINGTGLLFRTTIPDGASIKLVESPNDLTIISYDGATFVFYSDSVNSLLTSNKKYLERNSSCGWDMYQSKSSGWWHDLVYGERSGYDLFCSYYSYDANGISVSIPGDVYVKDIDTAVSGSFSGEYTKGSGDCCSFSTTTVDVSVGDDYIISSTTHGDYEKITNLSKSYVIPATGTFDSLSVEIAAEFSIQEAEPYTQQLEFTTDAELVYTMPQGDMYLIVETNGQTVTIFAQAFDADEDVFFKVDGLLPDIAYDITKSGIVGKTSNSGEISLLYNDVDFGISSSPGGILTIYPDSAKYLGTLGIGMIDVYNEYSIPLSIGDDMAYIPQNYVYWVFPVEVEFENVMIDDIAIN